MVTCRFNLIIFHIGNLLQASDEPVFCASPGENNIPDVIRRGVFLNGCGREETPLTTRDDIQVVYSSVDDDVMYC